VYQRRVQQVQLFGFFFFFFFFSFIGLFQVEMNYNKFSCEI
jgi:hypothetical protein